MSIQINLCATFALLCFWSCGSSTNRESLRRYSCCLCSLKLTHHRTAGLKSPTVFMSVHASKYWSDSVVKKRHIGRFGFSRIALQTKLQAELFHGSFHLLTCHGDTWDYRSATHCYVMCTFSTGYRTQLRRHVPKFLQHDLRWAWNMFILQTARFAQNKWKLV